jgi:D-alanyl-lipoteichoic acid acyltransferase DltB (MBOAT superfamily)
VASSYVFYGWWDVWFLSLLLLSTCIDFLIGQKLSHHSADKHRKLWLYISIFSNLGILATFKYCGFFIENVNDVFSIFGAPLHFRGLEIILPVGISFYTFQTMSYTIDVYRRRMEPTQDFIAFAAYVSFFPQLVAGPIERAKHLLPQFTFKRTFDYGLAVCGSKQILWGFFKKLVIADNCAILADEIFNHPTDYAGSTLWLGAVCFAFQIYGDFSGYSDIAIGTSRLLGFDLMKNFAFPYFSRDMAEFWRRWHISLSTWFRDYVYIPLGGNQGSASIKLRNILLVFLLSGFWHGANWTFIAWGLLNALLFVPLLIFGKNRQHLEIVAFDKKLPTFREAVNMGFTFILVTLLWIFFRSDSITVAIEILRRIFSVSLFTVPVFAQKGQALITGMLVIFFMVIEWNGRRYIFAIEHTYAQRPTWLRWGFFAMLISLIGMYMHTGGSPFIYFQF